MPAIKGKKWSKERKEKHSKMAREKGFGNWMTGKKLPEQVKKKIRLGNLGKIVSLEARKNISNAQKGKKLSEEHKQKIRDTLSKSDDELNVVDTHRRIIKKYGKANCCENRKKQFLSFRCEKLKNTGKFSEKYDWSNTNHKYSLNIEEWKKLCRKCHQNYDIINKLRLYEKT